MPKIIDNRSVLARLFGNILEVRFYRASACNANRSRYCFTNSVCLSV